MPEALKHLIDARTVALIAEHVGRAGRGFDRAAFRQAALAGLDTLELKARVMQLARALAAALPADADRALGLLEASLGPPGIGDDLASLRPGDGGLAGWPVWPLTEAVVLIAADAPERALAALHAMTQRSSAEFAIRPFIARHPAPCFETLARWTRDPSAHVRRLVSEGSRPRLPWGLRLQALVADPSPTLPLLRALQDDPSPYVRRSVANHLNDIARDHPALVAGWLAEHLPGAGAERRALLRHASRGLVKRGDAAVLAAWGVGGEFRGRAALAVSPAVVREGDDLAIAVTLASTSPRAQKLVIDYAVHHRGAHGDLRPKVFKGWTIELAPGEQRTLQRRHPTRPVTTRRVHPGEQAIDLRINGRVVGQASWALVPS